VRRAKARAGAGLCAHCPGPRTIHSLAVVVPRRSAWPGRRAGV